MDEETRKAFTELVDAVEEALEGMLELEIGDREIEKVLEEGFTCNTGEGMPTFEIKLVPSNIRDTLRLL